MKSKLYTLLGKHSDALRGASGAAALGVLAWGLWGDSLKERYWPTPPILVIHEYSISNAVVGGKMRISAIISKTRDECDARVKLQFVDRNGVLHVIDAPQTATPVLERVPWVIEVPLSDDLVVGEATITGVVSYSHPNDDTCNKSYRVPTSVFRIYPSSVEEVFGVNPIDQTAQTHSAPDTLEEDSNERGQED